MAGARIVIANGSLAAYREAGGLWALFLQYPLGLRGLGHDVLWLETTRSTGDRDLDRRRCDDFLGRMRQHGLDDCCAVLVPRRRDQPATLETCDTYGKTAAQIADAARTADLLWNLAGTLRQPLLSLFKRRVLVDGDPGHVQVCALEMEMGQSNHDVFLTVGLKMRDPDCEAPTLGLTWHPFPQFVYLPMWSAGPDPGPAAPFSSVTQWNWDQLWLANRVLSTAKRDGYLPYLHLPRRAGRPFELAANIRPDDTTGDRELLRSGGWSLADPNVVADSPESYRDYIRRSRAEISCPKPIFRELKTGWFSDRSACYLASGRPVLAEDTGFSDHLPTGEGLIAFRDMEGAVAGAGAIDAHYARHSRAARALAEEYLDSRRCLNAMLEACA